MNSRRAQLLTRALAVLAGSALGACRMPAGRAPDVPPQSASILYGARDLGDEWSPGDDQQVIGVMVELHRPWTGYGVEFGALRGVDDSSGNIDNSVDEFFLGAHFESLPGLLDLGPLVFWAGAGVTWARGELDEGDDDALGRYAQGGLRWWLGAGTSLGVALRWTDIDRLEIDGRRLDPSYVQGLLVVGLHF